LRHIRLISKQGIRYALSITNISRQPAFAGFNPSINAIAQLTLRPTYTLMLFDIKASADNKKSPL
jgi:hypothetical protein